jgi:hypothetical protein
VRRDGSRNRELNRVPSERLVENWESLGMAVEDDDKKGLRLCKEDFMCAAEAVRLL